MGHCRLERSDRLVLCKARSTCSSRTLVFGAEHGQGSPARFQQDGRHGACDHWRCIGAAAARVKGLALGEWGPSPNRKRASTPTRRRPQLAPVQPWLRLFAACRAFSDPNRNKADAPFAAAPTQISREVTAHRRTRPRADRRRMAPDAARAPPARPSSTWSRRRTLHDSTRCMLLEQTSRSALRGARTAADPSFLVRRCGAGGGLALVTVVFNVSCYGLARSPCATGRLYRRGIHPTPWAAACLALTRSPRSYGLFTALVGDIRFVSSRAAAAAGSSPNYLRPAPPMCGQSAGRWTRTLIRRSYHHAWTRPLCGGPEPSAARSTRRTALYHRRHAGPRFTGIADFPSSLRRDHLRTAPLARRCPPRLVGHRAAQTWHHSRTRSALTPSWRA